MGHSRPLFIYFRLFNTVDNKQMFNKILPMTGVEPRTSGIEIDRSTNWATTTSCVSLLSKAATQSWFWWNTLGILHQILNIGVWVCFWNIGIQSSNILIIVWASRTSTGTSEYHLAGIIRHILNSKSSFLNKIRISETL